MMKTSLDRAISQAAAEALARREEMSRALHWAKIAELLGAQADDARASPLAYDQLVAIALDGAAQPGAFDAPLLDALRAPIDPVAQIEVRRDVLGTMDAPAARALAKAAPDWAANRAGERMRRDRELLAGWLRAAADLNMALWDHPAFAAGPTLRAAMLASRATLKRRADNTFKVRREAIRPFAAPVWGAQA